jgi:hypothetical protein
VTVHGTLVTILVAGAVTYVGWQIGLREGDGRGLIGWIAGLLVLIAGVTWMLDV